MNSIEDTIKALSEDLYWKYKDIWDGYVENEQDLFRQIKENESASRVRKMILEIKEWRDQVSDEIF